jgi:hypothetical protein
MRIFLKVLNPFIFLINLGNYFCHLENYRHIETDDSYDFGKEVLYDHYDFSKDIKYF